MATEQPYFDDVEPGDEIGPVQKVPNREEIRGFLSVAGPPQPGSYRFFSDEAAQKEGLRAAIVPGSFSVTLLAKLLTDWAGPRGRLRKLEVSFRRIANPDEPLALQGIIIDKEVVDGEGQVRVDVSVNNLDRGNACTVGTAVVILPQRG